MYPFNFKPERRSINDKEIFVAMPFDDKYDPILSKLIDFSFISD